MAFILFLGGIHSGKTRLAELWAEGAAPARLILSTRQAPAQDHRPIVKPKSGPAWHYLHDPLEPLAALKLFQTQNPDFDGSIVLESIGMWIGNLMSQNLPGKEILRRAAVLSASLKQTLSPCALVSEEAGLAPPALDKITEKYTHLLGVANQIFARDSHCAIMVISGLPLLLKGSMPAILDRALRGNG